MIKVMFAIACLITCATFTAWLSWCPQCKRFGMKDDDYGRSICRYCEYDDHKTNA